MRTVTNDAITLCRSSRQPLAPTTTTARTWSARWFVAPVSALVAALVPALVLTTLVTSGLALPAAAQSVPSTISFQGRLTDNTAQHNPVDATLQMRFEIWDVPVGGSQVNRLWEEPPSGTIPVSVVGGLFDIQLGGNGTPISPSLFAGGAQRYLQIVINGETLDPRQPLSAVAYANRAAQSSDADRLAGTAAASWQMRVTGGCPDGYSIRSVNPDGSVVCQPSSGASYSAGPGLSLTGGQFSVNFDGNGSAASVSRSDHTHLPSPMLLVSHEGTGGGTVAGSGLSCSGNCAFGFTPGTPLTLSATPDPQSTFDGWSDACSGTGSCSLSMDTTKSVTATFTARSYTLTTSVVGSGFSLSNPLVTDCPPICTTSVKAGTNVSLVTIPNKPAYPSTFHFNGWSGACSGTGSCSLTMDSDKAVTAHWGYPITVVVYFAGGTVVSDPPGINCHDGPCTGYFDEGVSVTLTATPAVPGMPQKWGPCNAAQVCTFVLDNSATYAYAWSAPFTVAVAGNGSGKITSSPYTFSCPSTCTLSTTYGEPITFTATANAGSTFAGWSNGCTGTGTCTLPAKAGPLPLTATFTSP